MLICFDCEKELKDEYLESIQKENGINIKSFWAQNPNDRALYDLIHILVNIALEEVDVRDGLEKYKEDIVGKITSNIYNAQLRY